MHTALCIAAVIVATIGAGAIFWLGTNFGTATYEDGWGGLK